MLAKRALVATMKKCFLLAYTDTSLEYWKCVDFPLVIQSMNANPHKCIRNIENKQIYKIVILIH